MNQSSEKVQQEVRIAIEDSSNSKLGEFIKKQENIKVIEVENVNKSVKDGDIYLFLDIPEEFELKISSKENANINILYDNSSQESSTAVSIVKAYIDKYSSIVVDSRLKELNIDTCILTPFEINSDTVENESDGYAKLILTMLLPLLLIL